MLKRIIGKTCHNAACANQEVLVPSDLHVCDTCAEPLAPVKVWNRPVLALLCLVAVGAIAGAVYLSRRAPAPPQLPDIGNIVVQQPHELTLAFMLELQDGGQVVAVAPDHTFHSGDRFRVVLKPDFDAYVYIFNRNPTEARVKILYPVPANTDANTDKVRANRETRAPGPSEWFAMDKNPSEEGLIVVASLAPLPELKRVDGSSAREDFETWLAPFERERNARSHNVFRDANWVKIIADASQAPPAFVYVGPLKHE